MDKYNFSKPGILQRLNFKKLGWDKIQGKPGTYEYGIWDLRIIYEKENLIEIAAAAENNTFTGVVQNNAQLQLVMKMIGIIR